MLPFVSQIRRARLHSLSKQFFNDSQAVDASTPQFLVGVANGFLPRQVRIAIYLKLALNTS